MVDDAPLLGFRIGVFLDRNHVALLEGSSHERPEHWTIDRLQRRKRPVQPAINAGALPAEKPPRPQGVERNLVVTQWDWSDPKAYMHDEIASDKRDPTVNAGGLIYGAPEESTDDLPVLDPVKHVATTIHIPVRDPKSRSTRVGTRPFGFIAR